MNLHWLHPGLYMVHKNRDGLSNLLVRHFMTRSFGGRFRLGFLVALDAEVRFGYFVLQHSGPFPGSGRNLALDALVCHSLLMN